MLFIWPDVVCLWLSAATGDDLGACRNDLFVGRVAFRVCSTIVWNDL